MHSSTAGGVFPLPSEQELSPKLDPITSALHIFTTVVRMIYLFEMHQPLLRGLMYPEVCSIGKRGGYTCFRPRYWNSTTKNSHFTCHCVGNPRRFRSNNMRPSGLLDCRSECSNCRSPPARCPSRNCITEIGYVNPHQPLHSQRDNPRPIARFSPGAINIRQSLNRVPIARIKTSSSNNSPLCVLHRPPEGISPSPPIVGVGCVTTLW